MCDFSILFNFSKGLCFINELHAYLTMNVINLSHCYNLLEAQTRYEHSSGSSYSLFNFIFLMLSNLSKLPFIQIPSSEWPSNIISVIIFLIYEKRFF